MDGSGQVPAEDLQLKDVKSVRQQKEDKFYADRVRVYPQKVTGTFRRLKWMALAVLLAIYYVLPWIPWDRGPTAPDRAVFVDMEARRAYFFFIEIWPQEVFYLTGILVLAALGLFLVTSLAGRVWCGYACPQTVWTDLFMWVERKIEGDRNARIKLDKGGFSSGKAAKKVAKHGAWLAIAFLTGGAWIMYFVPAPQVVSEFFTGQSTTTTYFFVGLFTATTYLLAGWAREQVCTYMCPWPRFQAAMFDEDTLVVTYEKWRGEPRGKHIKKKKDQPDAGHCIDCNQCVAVCPMGIDIRDGVQLECIGCALCIDACNNVMEKVGLPGNLITYDTERRQALRAKGEEMRYRLLRPRTVLYSMLLLGVAGLMLYSLLSRSEQEINVLHDRAPLFVRLSDGSIRNGYEIKILNKVREERRFVLTMEGLEGATMNLVGREGGGLQGVILSARPDTVTSYRVYVRLPAERVTSEQINFSFVLTERSTGERATRETVFRGPEQ